MGNQVRKLAFNAAATGVSLMVLFFSLPIIAQTVGGTVVDCLGRPVAGAKITLYRVTLTGPKDVRTVTGERSMDTDPTGGFGFPQGGGVLDGGTYFVRVICPVKTMGGVLQSQEFFLSPAYTTGNSKSLKFICCPTGGVQSPNDKGTWRDFGGRMESANPGPDEKPPEDWHVQPIALNAAKFIHTDDWEDGDEVTISVRGYVMGEQEPEKQTEGYEAEARGYVVNLEDSEGHRVQVPWSPIIHYTVQAASGDVTASLMRPDQTVVTTTTIPIHPSGSMPRYHLEGPPKGSCVASPVSQIGREFTVHSPTNRLSPGAGTLSLLVKDEAGQTQNEYTPLAQSPRSAIFHPGGSETGRHTFTVREAGAFEESFVVYRLGVLLDTSRVYPKGKKGKLLVRIWGFPNEKEERLRMTGRGVRITVDNKTPNVLAYTREPNHIEWMIQGKEIKGDGSWEREIEVQAMTSGRFEDTAGVTAPTCVNPTTSHALPPPATPSKRGAVPNAGECINDPAAATKLSDRSFLFEKELIQAGCTAKFHATVQVRHKPGYEWNVVKCPVSTAVESIVWKYQETDLLKPQIDCPGGVDGHVHVLYSPGFKSSTLNVERYLEAARKWREIAKQKEEAAKTEPDPQKKKVLKDDAEKMRGMADEWEQKAREEEVLQKDREVMNARQKLQQASDDHKKALDDWRGAQQARQALDADIRFGLGGAEGEAYKKEISDKDLQVVEKAKRMAETESAYREAESARAEAEKKALEKAFPKQ